MKLDMAVETATAELWSDWGVVGESQLVNGSTKLRGKFGEEFELRCEEGRLVPYEFWAVVIDAT
jgi:hypothetical protein